MKSYVILLLLILKNSYASDAEQKNPNVEILNFERLFSLVQTKDIENSLILFYSPNCPHCAKFKPIYYEFANENPDPNLKLMEIDCLNDYKACELIKINRYPLVYYFKNDRMHLFEKRHLKPEFSEFIQSGYLSSQNFAIPTELPTWWENTLEGFNNIQEEIYYTFFESDSYLLKGLMGVLIVLGVGMSIGFLYLMVICVKLVFEKETEKEKLKEE